VAVALPAGDKRHCRILALDGPGPGPVDGVPPLTSPNQLFHLTLPGGDSDGRESLDLASLRLHQLPPILPPGLAPAPDHS